MADPGRIRLRQLSGANVGRVMEFEQPVVRIGRLPDLDFVFDAERDLDASGEHAEIRLDAGEFILLDLGSRNGTWVNNLRITRHSLRSGDKINFGRGGPGIRFEVAGQSSSTSLFFEQVSAKRVPILVGIGALLLVGLFVGVMSSNQPRKGDGQTVSVRSKDAIFFITHTMNATERDCLAVAIGRDRLVTAASCIDLLAREERSVVGSRGKVTPTQLWKHPAEHVGILRVRPETEPLAFAELAELSSIRRGSTIFVASSEVRSETVQRIWHDEKSEMVFFSIRGSATPGTAVLDRDAKLLGIVVSAEDGVSTVARAEAAMSLAQSLPGNGNNFPDRTVKK